MQDFNEFSPSLQFCLSAILAATFIVFLGFVLSRLCFGGPNAKGFFAKKTHVKSILAVRPRNPDFDYKKYIRENPRSHMVSQFWLCRLNCFCIKSKQNQSEIAGLYEINGKFSKDNPFTERNLLTKKEHDDILEGGEAIQGDDIQLDEESAKS